MKRIVLLIGLLLVVVGLFAQTAIAPTQGDGSVDNPYQIASWQNLYWISQTPGVWDKNFIQTADIDLSTTDPAITTWDNGTGWTPIGKYIGLSSPLNNPFTGYYDGNTKTIRGLFINRPNTDYQGLFGATYNAHLDNIGLINVNVSGHNAIGGLVGDSERGVITKCYSTGVITGIFSIGGLVGDTSSQISSCYNTGSVTGNRCTGGLLGACSSFASSTITNCFNTGSVTGTNDILTGGLIGYNISNVSFCFNAGSVTTSRNTGGLIGGTEYEYEVTILNSFWDLETAGQTNSDGGTGKTTAEMKMQSTYTDAGWDFSTIWTMDPAINNGYPYLCYSTPVPTNDPYNTIPNSLAVLHAAYPNPFNPSTTISFDVLNAEQVVISIYNIKGQLVKNMCNQVYDKGYHSIIWNGTDNKGTKCSTGVYFYKMQAGRSTQTKKMMMIK